MENGAPPEIVGLCEVENRKVLDDLVSKTPLSRVGYEIVHYESPDRRGIDVALLFRPDKLELISSKPIPIHFRGEPNRKTRDILYVKGLTQHDDTLHVFINHWPSRWGGQLETEPLRMFVASVLRHQVDSIFAVDSTANLIITGDLNDEPEDKSVSETLNAEKSFSNITKEQIYNLSFYLKDEKQMGSHKHQGEWGMLDQIIVSGALLDKQSSFYTGLDHTHVFNEGFLLEDDRTYLGKKPFRTYIGFSFNDGFSDHLPVYIDLFFN